MRSAATDPPQMIEIADLWKSFGAVEVLKGVSLKVGRGAVIAVIGPSGSGKSTLLRCVNLLEEPDRGQIRVGGVGYGCPSFPFFTRWILGTDRPGLTCGENWQCPEAETEPTRI